MSNLNNYECFIFCSSTSMSCLTSCCVEVGQRHLCGGYSEYHPDHAFPCTWQGFQVGQSRKGQQLPTRNRKGRSKQIGNKCAWSARKVLRCSESCGLQETVISVINKSAFLGKSSRVDLLMCVSGRGAVVA